jgi:steroid 5-alpha reductase family enzyme|tara:strand:+ start:98 stop:961 length:864 start_codon:yes stop_codon:yes gene_type:complete
MIKDKGISQLICISIYIVSFYLAYVLLPESINFIWLKITIWHLNATIFIYLGSVLLKNSSLYDPFWSVAPVPIVIYLSIQSENSILLKMLIIFPILLWATRLTRNWVISWEGFHHEDFRYIDLKNTNKYKAEFNNFFGIHLFPTFIVNICLYPLVYVFINDVDVNVYLYISSIITLIAVILETVADEQMRKFRSDPRNKGKTMKYKLWRYSRHPNYLGEVGFWFGIYFMGISSGFAPLWLIVCPLAMLLLFVLVSCPMMDERSLKNRPNYKEYMDNTSQLMLLPPKN